MSKIRYRLNGRTGVIVCQKAMADEYIRIIRFLGGTLDTTEDY